jgi:hypothetical protein
VPKAAVNFTISTGDKQSPGLPPIVPLIPDIDFISAIQIIFSVSQRCKKNIN